MPQKYVEDIVAPAIVDTLILGKAQSGAVSVPDIERVVQGWTELTDKVDVTERLDMLVQSGHLRRDGNTFRATEDGKQDVQKVLPWFRNIQQQVTAAPGGMR